MGKKLLFGFFLLLAAGLGAAKAYVDRRIDLGVARAAAQVAEYAAVQYRGAGLAWDGGLAVEALQARVPGLPPLEVARFTLHIKKGALPFLLKREAPPFMPARILAEARDIRVALDGTDGQGVPALISALGYADYYLSPKELAALGYREVVADLRLTADSDAPQGGLRLRADLDLRGIGGLALTLDLLYPPPLTPLGLRDTPPEQIRLAGLVLEYRDRGLLPRLAAYLAQRQKLTPQALRAQLAERVAQNLNGLGLPPDALDGLSRFIREGQGVTLGLRPDAPRAARELLQAAGGGLQTWNLKISANESIN